MECGRVFSDGILKVSVKVFAQEDVDLDRVFMALQFYLYVVADELQEFLKRRNVSIFESVHQEFFDVGGCMQSIFV